MTRFILIAFAVLGFGFYELSGGSEFDPDAQRAAAVEARIVRAAERNETIVAALSRPASAKAPAPVEVAALSTSPDTDTVTRTTVNLVALDTSAPAALDASAAPVEDVATPVALDTSAPAALAAPETPALAVAAPSAFDGSPSVAVNTAAPAALQAPATAAEGGTARETPLSKQVTAAPDRKAIAKLATEVAETEKPLSLAALDTEEAVAKSNVFAGNRQVAQSSLAENAPDIRRVNRDLVKMRSGPGLGYSVVAPLTHATEVEVLSASENGWLELRPVAGGQTGWIAEFLLTEG